MQVLATRLALKKAVILAAGLFLLPAIGWAATITSLKANSTSIGKYEKYELTFNLTGVSPADYNPFRHETTGDSLSPAGVDVWAEVITPSGDVKKVWGFWDVDFEYLGNSIRYSSADRFVPSSAPHWHVRFAPTQLGTHKITVRVKDAGGTTASSQLTFNCVSSAHKGFVQISPDGSRFVYADGSPFVPFGMSMPYGTQHVATTTSKMKANGMNFIRRWLVNRDKDDIHRNLEGWASYSSDSSVYRTGKRSAVKNISGTGTLVDQSFVGVRGNTYYKAFAYIRTSSTFNGTAAVSLVEARADGSNATRDGNTVGGGKNWTYSEVVFKTASNAEVIHLKPRVISGSAGTVWIDDAGLYECDSSGNVTVDFNMLFNPSFEAWTPAQLRLHPLIRFEYLLQMAEANDIVVQPAIFDYRLWNKSSPVGFYAQHFGDWWTDSESIAQQERVLRYLVARFGHYRSLFAWELTNEMDGSYTSVRGDWIAGRSNFIRSGDPYRRLMTNSYWSSPADYRYAQMPEVDLSQVHYYINTEERNTDRGYPFWWSLSSGFTLETNTSNVASGSKSLRASANGSTLIQKGNLYVKPNRTYTLRYKVKTSSVNGQASVNVRLNGGSSPGSSVFTNSTGTSNFTTRTQDFTTGSTCVSASVELQLTGTSGTAWWDDVEVIDKSTGKGILYNGGFEGQPFGDDEFEWAVYNTIRSNERYDAGPVGVNKPWVSGEWGLMGPDFDLSYWARPNDSTKPRKDSTGIHVHNCIWAQLMASASLNTPTYWWVVEYILPYNLHSVWKGATSFASALPFYDRRQSVSTEPQCMDIVAATSNSRIRLLGQKSGSNGYFWIQNREHTWSRVIREGLSPTPTSATLTIAAFENGSYTVNWYDTRTGSLVSTETRSVSGGQLSLSVSSLATDIAVIVQKVESQQADVSLTLAVDKTTASPSDVLTYTLVYKNNGSGDATNVELTLPIPANTDFVSGSASGGGTYSSSTNSVRWVIPSLAPGASGQCVAKVTVN